jgi:hypothetical protein
VQDNDSSLRHNAVRDRLANAAQGGKFAASIEKRGVLIDRMNLNQRMFVFLWSYGKAIDIDICGSSVDFSSNVEEPSSNALNRKNANILVRVSFLNLLVV